MKLIFNYLSANRIAFLITGDLILPPSFCIILFICQAQFIRFHHFPLSWVSFTQSVSPLLNLSPSILFSLSYASHSKTLVLNSALPFKLLKDTRQGEILIEKCQEHMRCSLKLFYYYFRSFS